MRIELPSQNSNQAVGYVPIAGGDIEDRRVVPAEKDSQRSGNLYVFGCILLSISLALLTVSRLRQASPLLEQPGLTRSMPFRLATHPDPPSALWGAVQKPYPTGAFWTNLAIKNGDAPIALYPYGIKCLEQGVQISYGAFRRTVTRALISDAFVSDIQVSSVQSYYSRAVESYDNVSVTMSYRVAGNGKYRAVMVKSSPFVTVVFDNATPLLSSPLMKFVNVEARVVKDSPGSQYLVTLGNYQRWLVYCSEPVVLTLKNNTLAAAAPFKGFVRMAVLPIQGTELAFSTLLSYVQRYPTGGAVTVSYPTPSSAVVQIQYASQGPGALLMLALPHHLPLLGTAVDSDESRKVQAAYSSIYCIKGKLKAIVGDQWRLTYALAPLLWNYNVADKLPTYQLDEIAKHLIEEVRVYGPLAADTYGFGKQLGRMARLALIADYLGIADARQQAIYNLETSIIPWLQNLSPDVLLYDKTYGGLVTSYGLGDSLAEFGSGWYSDHHFHYGYFINAAATLAKLDFPFFDANRAGFDAFVRDVCNGDPTDLDFPVARHKDFFDGHSWASGLFTQANGKGQESSSEAVNAYYGASLYGLATGNVDLQRFAQLLLAMEVQAAQTYWHMSTEDSFLLYDQVFSGRKMMGNMGGLDVTVTTWFGMDIEFVHGINMMPLSPATTQLFDAAFAAQEYPVIAAHMPPTMDVGNSMCSANANCKAQGLQGACCPSPEGAFLLCCDNYSSNLNRLNDEWKAYVYALLAVVDRDAAWEQLDLLPGFGPGNSRTNSLLWAATRSPPLASFNNTRRPPEAIGMRSACVLNTACDAMGMTGECCPSADGTVLGCCARI